MKNLLFIIFCGFSLFLAIFYYQKFTNTQQALELANRRILDRDTEIYRLQKRLGIMRSSNSVTNPQTTGSSNTLGKLSTSEINRLLAKGLQNPEADLRESLIKNQKTLLNQKGVLGGSMAIREIQILNDHYALAYFEDGHNGGYMILRYEVKNKGQIIWTVLDNYTI